MQIYCLQKHFGVLGARPLPMADEGSATREKARSAGHGSVTDDYAFDRSSYLTTYKKTQYFTISGCGTAW